METIPEEMIHTIQSFLPAKEAARTTILSKSWYTAWLTRPNLDFESMSPERSFVKSVKKTVQRYEELNLNIRSFRIRMYIPSTGDNSCEISLVNEMIAKAIKLNASDLDIDLTLGWSNFILPDEVLTCKSLLKISLAGVEINLQEKKLIFSKLKSLHLNSVRIEGNNLWDVIMLCPSIEKLELYHCMDNTGISVLKWGLRAYEFHKLKVLWLEDVRIDEEFFGHVSRFPCLMELGLHNCYGYGYGYSYREIQIHSNSLECIRFTYASVLKAKLDVPRLRKFKISSSYIPCLSFKTTSKECEFDISIKGNILKVSWFQRLRDFLLNLSSFKISLHLSMYAYSITSPTSIPLCDYDGDIGIPRVEKLTLLMDAPSSLHSTILENVFWSCDPIFITYVFS